MARRAILVTALVMVGLLAFLTLYVLFSSGPDMLVLISLLVLAVLGIGIFGALGETPRSGGDL
jgi:hypothetical protein